MSDDQDALAKQVIASRRAHQGVHAAAAPDVDAARTRTQKAVILGRIETAPPGMPIEIDTTDLTQATRDFLVKTCGAVPSGSGWLRIE